MDNMLNDLYSSLAVMKANVKQPLLVVIECILCQIPAMQMPLIVKGVIKPPCPRYSLFECHC